MISTILGGLLDSIVNTDIHEYIHEYSINQNQKRNNFFHAISAKCCPLCPNIVSNTEVLTNASAFLLKQYFFIDIFPAKIRKHVHFFMFSTRHTV